VSRRRSRQMITQSMPFPVRLKKNLVKMVFEITTLRIQS
jgi:hypothetical protein